MRMLPSWLRRPHVPRTLRRQFQLALLAFALLVVAGGLTAIDALRTSALATRDLAEERLVRLQQAQGLVQQAMLIERESRRMLAAPDRTEMQHHYGTLIEQLEIFDTQLDRLGDAHVSVLGVLASAQSLRNSAHVVAQLRDSTLRTEGAFDHAMEERSLHLSGPDELALESLAAVLYRLHGATRGDEVRELKAGFVRAASTVPDLPSTLRMDLEALQKQDASEPGVDPFSLRIALIAYREGIERIDKALQHDVGAIVEATQRWSDQFTAEYRQAMQGLLDTSTRNQVRVTALLAASLLLAWAVARFFLGGHVLARLQQVSDFLRRDDDEGPTEVPVRGQDEIGQMARAVEQFIAARRQLARLNDALASAKSDLEQKVAERTEDLRAANARLQGELGERRRAEAALAVVNRALRMLSESNQTLIHARDERALLNHVCGIVVSVGGYAMAWVGFAGQDGAGPVCVVAHAGIDSPSLGEPGDTDPVRMAMRSGQIAVVRSGSDHGSRDALGLEETARGYCAFVALPLVSSGRTFGVLCAYSTAPEAFDDGEVDILAELAGDLAFGIKTLRARDEHARAEAALQRSERHLRSIYENSPLAYQALDSEGRYTEVNPAWCSLMALTRDQALGRRHADDLLQESAERLEVLLSSIGEQGEVHGIEFEVRRHDGGRLEVGMDAKVGCDEAGRFRELHCLLHDITQRKATEQELRLAATAFESQEGMFITDADANILRVNRAFTQITGYSGEDCIGHKPSLHESEQQGAAFYAAMWQAIRRDGTWQGEIWNRRKDGEAYPEWRTFTAVRNEAGEITHYVGTVIDITQRKAAEEEIRELAFYDQLTRLPNRRLLVDRLKQAMAASSRSGRQGALLFIDLDNFKTLNDTSGHDMGDLLLKEVAHRLVAGVREGDTVARLGGDEFVIILEGLSTDAREAAALTQAVGEKIISTLNEPYLLAGREHHSTPSIGATLFIDGVNSLEELLRQADIAMYQAKSGGRNTLRFFNPDMQEALSARARLEADLRQGLFEGQFVLHYQAQVDEAWRIVGAEALLRWQQPVRGRVSPAEFIPLAEDTGLILPLGQWVLETACRQLAAWAAQPACAHLRLAVNVSARQFRQADFVDQVKQALTTSGVNPRLLELELTESLLLDDVEDTIFKMEALKREGVRFSLDDFGTGYSSLSYLKRLPLDQLKIDQSFVRDVLTDANDAAIARTIVALARSLGLDVIAEGVETCEQRDFLANQDCHAYQGFLFSRPLPAEEFERLSVKGAKT